MNDGAGKSEPDELHGRLLAFVGRTSGAPRVGADLVNAPMIRHWCQAMGDANPAYGDPEWAVSGPFGQPVAPPAMLQSWTHHDRRFTVAPDATEPDNAEEELVAVLADAGYTSVVATGATLRFHRYLVPGDQVAYLATIRAVSARKRTKLGMGYFVTTEMSYADADDRPVGAVDFVTLRFRPARTGQDA